jgi:hypothetical protein
MARPCRPPRQAAGSLEERNGVLGTALAQSMARDDSKADPDARRAANTAMNETYAMLRAPHSPARR